MNEFVVVDEFILRCEYIILIIHLFYYLNDSIFFQNRL